MLGVRQVGHDPIAGPNARPAQPTGADATDRQSAPKVISRAGRPPSCTHTNAVSSSAPLRNRCWAQFNRAPVNQRVNGMGSVVRTWVHSAEKSTPK